MVKAIAKGRATHPGEPQGNAEQPEPGSLGTARPTCGDHVERNAETKAAAGRASRPGEPPRTLPQRKPLGHAVPPWVKPGSTYFITICAKHRLPSRPLLHGDIAEKLIASVRNLHDRGEWYARLFVVMPDHVHGLIAVPAESSMAERIVSWKRYHARINGITWQERFFDHRVRAGESLDEKIAYMRDNPVRAGLAESAEAWPYLWDSVQAEQEQPSLLGTARPTV